MNGQLAQSLIDQVSLWGLNVVIHATVLASASLLVALSLRRAAAMRYWVLCFGLVLVLVSPVTSALIQATGNSWLKIAVSPVSEPTPRTVNPDVHRPMNDVRQPIKTDPLLLSNSLEIHDDLHPKVKEFAPSLADSTTISAVSIAPMVEPIAPVPPSNGLKALLRFFISPLLLIWATGTAILLLRMSIGWRRLSRILRAAKPISDEQLQTAFDRACSTAGCRNGRRPQLVTSNVVSGPIAAGVLRSKVVLPEGLVEQVDPESIADVLVHEVAHVVRRDQIVVLLQNIVSAIYWPHPLVRRLNCELAKAREEVCDNFVLTATAAPSYSRTLLSLAQLIQHSRAMPGSVGFFTDRWRLEHRIAGLLDKHRNRTTFLSKRGWLFVAATSALLAGLTCFSTITIATIQVDAAISSEPQIASKEIKVSGVVLKPDGSPAAGATVRAAALVSADMRGVLGNDFKSPMNEVVADKHGRFEISIESEPYGEMPVKGTKWEDFWKRTVISATLLGFAGQFTQYKDVEGVDTVTLQLVEDTPIRGRVIGLEGKPISGVTIEVKDILVSPNESLDGWLKAVRNGEPAWTAVKQVSRQIEPRMLGVPETVMTDSDGAFTIKRLGKERCIRLHAHGNGIAFEDFQVATRSLEPLTWNDVGRPDSPASVYGVEFTLAGRPSRTVHGTVIDAKSGMPLAGVDVAVEKISGKNIGGNWLLPTKTDPQGRFRMDDMPKGKGNRLMFRPLDDQPYLMREIDVPDSDGIDPIAIEVALHRGIWIEGKVVDKQSRKPVAGVRVHYLPLLTNKYAGELPEFADGNVDGQQDRFQTDARGNYRVVGLPGPAIVGVQSVHRPYRRGYGYDALTAPKDKHGVVQTYQNPIDPRPKWPDSMAQIDPGADTQRVELNFELDPGQTIRVSVVDESNEWLTGAYLVNRGMSRQVTIERAPVDVTNVAPNESREIIVHHEQRGLGVVYHLTAANIAEGHVRLTAQRCARISGRLVNDGEPLSGISVIPGLLPSVDFNQSLSTVTTDENGFFNTVLIPGCKYRLRMEGEPFRSAHFEEDIAISPGENIELGTLVLSNDRKFKRTNEPRRDASSKVSGHTLGPNGQPIAATLWVGGPGRSSEWSRTPMNVAWNPIGTSGTDGRFRITLPQAENEPTNSEPLVVRLAATADGLGFAWAVVTLGKTVDEFTLRLVNDTPIRGRIVTLDGAPAINIQLNVVEVTAPDSLPDSTTIVKNAALHNTSIYTNWPAWPGGSPLTRAVVTDSDGRFQLSGLGSERHVRLEALGDGIAATRLSIITREKPSDSASGAISVRTGLSESSYFADFTHIAVPERIVRGTVVDQTTGHPIPDVKVIAQTSWASRKQPAVTDASGNFAIRHVPKGTEYTLELSPTGASHFRSRETVPDTAGNESLDMKLTLASSIKLRGRVVDEATGAGVEGEIVYNALFPNEAINTLGDSIANPLSTVQTDTHGHFEISVLPGPGAVSVQVQGEQYATVLLQERDVRKIFSAGELELQPDAMGQIWFLQPAAGGQRRGMMGLSRVHAVELLKLSQDDPVNEITLTLRRGVTLQGEIVDEKVEPVSGVTAIGLGPSSFSLSQGSLKTNQFSVLGLLPESKRTLMFLQKERSLGATLQVTGKQRDLIQVELKPTGSISGLLLDSEGDPITNGSVSLTPVELGLLTELWTADVDGKGRFSVDHLLSGVPYSLRARVPGQPMELFVRGNIRTESGEQLDIGAFRQNDKFRFSPVEMKAAPKKDSDQ